MSPRPAQRVPSPRSESPPRTVPQRGAPLLPLSPPSLCRLLLLPLLSSPLQALPSLPASVSQRSSSPCFCRCSSALPQCFSGSVPASSSLLRHRSPGQPRSFRRLSPSRSSLLCSLLPLQCSSGDVPQYCLPLLCCGLFSASLPLPRLFPYCSPRRSLSFVFSSRSSSPASSRLPCRSFPALRSYCLLLCVFRV